MLAVTTSTTTMTKWLGRSLTSPAPAMTGTITTALMFASRFSHTTARPLTRIVATIGPASESEETIRGLIESGVSIFRLNFSHGTLEDHDRRLTNIRKAASNSPFKQIAVLGDLQGPKIRVGKVPKEGIRLVKGQRVIFQKSLPLSYVADGGAAVFNTTYEPLIHEAKVGHRVLINDGLVRLESLGETNGELHCSVAVGGLVTSSKGINLPDSSLSAPAITMKDWECVAWAVKNGLDFLALSFVRHPEDVLQLRFRLAKLAADHHGGTESAPTNPRTIPIIAKIEMPQALACLPSIIEACDGAMVARGDLGVELDLALVPVAQKSIIKACNAAGKPVIVATQMLESMVESSTPTRAEATDVCNSIFDGADAIMLSGETATGRHPVLVVETMAHLALTAEAHLATLPAVENAPTIVHDRDRVTAAIAHGVWLVAQDIKVKAVVCWSEQGCTARYLSQNSFCVPIVAFTSSAEESRRMCILRGVESIVARPPTSGAMMEWLKIADEYLIKRGLAEIGDMVVVVAGKPLGASGQTNGLALHKIGQYFL